MEQEKRGPGRPSLGKARMYFTLSGEVVKALQKLPAGERSQFVEDALKAYPKMQALLQEEK